MRDRQDPAEDPDKEPMEGPAAEEAGEAADTVGECRSKRQRILRER